MVKKDKAQSITVQELTDIIMAQAKEKGWGTKPKEIDVPEKMALIHSEVSEAFEAYRHKNFEGKDGFNVELGDVVTMVLHLCGILGIDIEQVILKKLKSNKTRTWDWKNLNEGKKKK